MKNVHLLFKYKYYLFTRDSLSLNTLSCGLPNVSIFFCIFQLFTWSLSKQVLQSHVSSLCFGHTLHSSELYHGTYHNNNSLLLTFNETIYLWLYHTFFLDKWLYIFYEFIIFVHFKNMSRLVKTIIVTQTASMSGFSEVTKIYGQQKVNYCQFILKLLSCKDISC